MKVFHLVSHFRYNYYIISDVAVCSIIMLIFILLPAVVNGQVVSTYLCCKNFVCATIKE